MPDKIPARTTTVTPYLAALRLVCAGEDEGEQVFCATTMKVLALLYGVPRKEVFADLCWANTAEGRALLAEVLP